MKKESYVESSYQNKTTDRFSAISNIAIAENIKTKETGAGCLNNYALEKCRSILQKDGEIFTDEELYLIYTYLNQMAELSVNEFLKSKS